MTRRFTRTIRSPSLIRLAWADCVKMAAELGRQARPDIHLGICGEHGGDPSSVEFCHKVGLDYVSCSPFRRADRAPCSGSGEYPQQIKALTNNWIRRCPQWQRRIECIEKVAFGHFFEFFLAFASR